MVSYVFTIYLFIITLFHAAYGITPPQAQKSESKSNVSKPTSTTTQKPPLPTAPRPTIPKATITTTSKPVLPITPRPSAQVAKIRAVGKKAVSGLMVSKEEQEKFTKAETDSIKEISDSELEENPFEGDTPEVSPTLKQKISERFAPVIEKLNDVKATLLEKSDVISNINNTLTEEHQPFGLEFPHLGKGYLSFEPDHTTGAIKLNLNFKSKGKTKLQVRPIALDQMRLEMVQGKLKGQLHKDDTITVFGEEARFLLKTVDLEGGYVNKAVLEVQFKNPIKKKLPYINEELTIKNGYLKLEPGMITLTARSEFRGQKVRLMLIYYPGSRLTAAVRVKKMPLVNLIPQVAEIAPFNKMNLIEGTVHVDLWVPSATTSEDSIHIPEDDPTRQLRISGQLEKIEELPLDDAIEDVDPEFISTEESLDFTDKITEDVKEDASNPITKFPEDYEAFQETTITSTSLDKMAESFISDTPASEEEPEPEAFEPTAFEYDESEWVNATEPMEEINSPDLVYPSDIEIDPELVEEAIPELDYADTDISLEDQLAQEAIEEGKPCDYLNDPCCREKNEKGEIDTNPNFMIECMFSRYSASIVIGGNDIRIPHVGLVSSANITLELQRSGVEREDVLLRPGLKKKTLKSARSFLRIDLACVPIRDIGVVENGYIQIGINSSQKERDGREVYTIARGRLELNGRMRLQFGSLGRLPIDVIATITRKGLIFTGNLDFCEQYSEEILESETGYTETKKTCLKNKLTYAGLTLENVRVIYGYPRYTAQELDVRETQKAMRRELKDMARERRNAIRQMRDDRKKGEESSPETIKTASSQKVGVDTVRKPEERKQLTLIATTDVWGIKFIATLALQPDPKTQKRKLGFAAKAVIKDFKPFKYIPGAKKVPGLKDINFSEISAELTMNMVRGRRRPSMKLGGAVNLFGMLLRANCKFVVNKKNIPGVFIYTLPQQQQALSDLIPVLQSDLFRNITCCNASFALSSVAEIDPAYFSAEEALELEGLFNLRNIRKGVAFAASVPFTGSLEQIGKWLGINKEPTQKEREQMAEEAKYEAEARAAGEKIPPKQFCGGQASMFRMLANINFKNPAFSEFRIGITRKKLRQFSRTDVDLQPQEGGTRSQYQGAQTRFSDETLQPFVKSTESSVKSLQRRQEQEKKTAARAAVTAAKQKSETPAQPVVEVDQVEVFFLGDVTRSSFGVAVGLLVRPTPEELLRLKGSVEFAPKDVTIGAQMLGTWHNAFTLKGWDLSNVAFLLGFLYGSVLPVRLGGAAELKVRKDFEIGFKFLADADITNMGFEGNISRVITWLDVINLFLKATKFPIPQAINNMPMLIEITNAYVRYAPKDLRLGEQIIESGFAIKADISLLNKKGKIDAHVDDTGLKAFGTLEKIEIQNVLHITSEDGKGDPKIDVEVSLDRLNFLITGKINIANIIEQSTFVEVSSSGFKFDFLAAIGKTAWHNKPLLMSKITGKSSGPMNDPQFNLVIDLEQNFLKFIKEKSEEALSQASKAVEAELNNAQREINKIDSVISRADAKIKEAQNKVNEARGALKTIQEARTQVNRTFEDAQRNVAKIRGEIEELDRWYQSLPAV